jgi:hypothetical protein
MIYFGIILLFTLIHAFLDSRRIKNNLYIDHFLRGAIWFFSCFIFYPFLSDGSLTYLTFFVLALLSIRKGFYDFALNKFRGLSFWYTSTTTTSQIDLFQQKIKINQNVVSLVALIGSLLLLTIAIIQEIY